MSAAMVEALTTLACASPANCFFQVSKPAAALRGARFTGHPHECRQDANGEQLELPACMADGVRRHGAGDRLAV
jgi:hypothetical protein